MVAGVILAGGRATRLGGGDKPLRLLHGKPLLAHVIDRLRPQVTALAINANGDPARFAAFDLPILPDPVPGQPGPLAGILAALDWAAARGEAGVITVPGDTPFLPADLGIRLGARLPSIAAGTTAGTCRLHPTIGHWPTALRDSLRDSLERGERRVGRWAAGIGAVPVAWPADTDPFVNINTPDDLARAQDAPHP